MAPSVGLDLVSGVHTIGYYPLLHHTLGEFGNDPCKAFVMLTKVGVGPYSLGQAIECKGLQYLALNGGDRHLYAGQFIGGIGVRFDI